MDEHIVKHDAHEDRLREKPLSERHGQADHLRDMAGTAEVVGARGVAAAVEVGAVLGCQLGVEAAEKGRHARCATSQSIICPLRKLQPMKSNEKQ